MRLSHLFFLNILVVSQSLGIEIPADTLQQGLKERDSFVYVVNNTNYDVEHLILWACDYLRIENVTICVANQHDYLEKAGMLVKHKDLYFLYLKEKLINYNLIVIHELIHLKQYKARQLVKIDPSTVNYKGLVINLDKVDYFQRLYESEAHSEDSKVLRKYFKHKKRERKNRDPEREIELAKSSEKYYR